jgi:ADP-dependent NAD(P)H-hydrate dehydratase / NAD(P)H-hydrate epimerase
MKVLTSGQMRDIDRAAIEDIGIPGLVLMENAGIQVTRAILARFPRVAEENVVIIAGKGNNGGDGFVVARHLFNIGCPLTVFLLAAKADVKGDAAVNLAIAEKVGIEVQAVPTIEAWKTARVEVFHASLIVDAIFGTGLEKPADGLYAAAIADINKGRGFKVAVDIPSGLSSDTHLVIGPAVKADLTVALAAPKICHVFPPGEDFVGELAVVPISIPPRLFEDERWKVDLVEKKNIRPYFGKRKKDTHKGSYGHLFVLAGSLGKTGAAVMAAKSALRLGAGLVTVGTPESCLPIIARAVIELMTEALPETEAKTLSPKALPRILDLLKGKDALLLGPGISTDPSTAKLVFSLLPKLRVPVLIDADGLNILAEDPEILKTLKTPAVLTPHPGEFARLVRLPVQDVLDRRLELVPRFAEKYGVYIVLKGYRTVMATPQGRVFINPTGNPGMATGGSGDVLSGMIASLLIQEKDLAGAVRAAVYLHGLCGDIGARKIGERPLIAGDLIKYVPLGLREIEQ